MKRMNQKQAIFYQKTKWPLLIIATMLFLSVLGYYVVLFGGSLVVDEEEFVLNLTTTVETTEGDFVGELYHEKRDFISLTEIPEHVKQAFVSIEDTRFYSHSGIDIRSVGRALYKDIIALSKVEGASTITQQLAKNMFLYNDKTWMRKTKEVMAAFYLERELTKDEILELYLNKIYFGNGIYGIETAAQHFFSKTVTELNLAEGALLAGLPKAPNGYSPVNHPEKAMNRRNLVLHVMEQQGRISVEEKLNEQGKTLGLNQTEREDKPWFDSYIDLVTKEAAEKHQISLQALKRGGYKIVVGVDERAQKIAFEQFKDNAYFPGNTEGVEGAFVMMNQETGSIVSAIGGRDYEIGDINRVTVKRQPGSAIKPLVVYAPALMTDYSVYSRIPDEKKEYDGYIPENIDRQYSGSVSIFEALSKSKNAPAVWLLNEIGIDYAKEYLTDMGIPIEDDGLAIALGGLSEGLTPLEMMTGYRTFAHDGKVIEPYTIHQIFDNENELIAESNQKEQEVFTPQTAWYITEILSRTVESANYFKGNFNKALAGKTGTTQHPRVDSMTKDAWFVGYTPKYVTALWMGFDHSDEDHYLVKGSEYPAGLTENILSEFDRYEDLATNFVKPDYVDDIPDPIDLPIIEDVEVSFTLGGIKLVQGKLTWSGSTDDRVVYHVYKSQDGEDERIGEVTGKTEFIIKNVSLFKTDRYYVVPYDPLTKIEGNKSEMVELTF